MTRPELQTRIEAMLKDVGVEDLPLVVDIMALIDAYSKEAYDRAVDEYWAAIIRNQDGRL